MTKRLRSFRSGVVVPGVAVRLLNVVVVAVGVVLLNPFPLWQGVAVMSALVAVVFPRSLAAWIAAACVVFGVVLTDPSPERTALAVLVVPAIHLLGSLSLTIPAASRLAPAVLLPGLRRFVIAQLVAQPLAFGVWLLAPGPVDRGAAWLAPLAAVVLLLGVLFALRAARAADSARGRVHGEGSGGEAIAARGADVRGPS
ncbi:hypothetical protein [Microbacterium sp. Y-01]|jgi:hypothetical protein|uniref:hypothetical protein n=1 Tax=Microbacterium TaxID=33882 RepID=UPI000F5E1480|nr:hypothetical protein [Microbacterium sp. Y-01]AZH78862.1 hypothetical protein CSX12_10495 [Microbacterium sp. Y-01]